MSHVTWHNLILFGPHPPHATEEIVECSAGLIRRNSDEPSKTNVFSYVQQLCYIISFGVQLQQHCACPWATFNLMTDMCDCCKEHFNNGE